MTFIPSVTGAVSEANSSSTPLGAAAAFTGAAQDAVQYATVTISCFADADSAPGGLVLQFSSDGSAWDLTTACTYLTSQEFSRSFLVAQRYLRVSFTNGAGAQTAFRLQTLLHLAKAPTAETLTVRPEGPLRDAFGRLRVAAPRNELELSYVRRDGNSAQETTETSGAGSITLDPSAPFKTLAVTGGGDLARVQTRERGVYQPGVSLLTYNTGVLNEGSNAAGATCRLGYFDADDGLFFEHRGNGAAGTAYVVRRSSATGAPVDEAVAQSAWNLDKLDGSGSSGLLANWAKAQIFVIDLEWLSVGRVRLGLNIHGVTIYVHEFLAANLLALPYMNLASQPCRAEALSSAGAGSMTHICSSVCAEGGAPEPFGRAFAATRATSLRTLTTTESPLMALRLKSGGQNPKVQVRLDVATVLVTTGGNVVFRLYMFRDVAAGTVLTGSSFVSADPESAVEFDVASTAVATAGGALLRAPFVSNNNDYALVELGRELVNGVLTTNLAGVSDLLVLSGETFSGNESTTASMAWKETL